MKKYIFILFLFIPNWAYGDEDDFNLMGFKNQENLKTRHRKIESIEELDTFIKEQDQLEQLDQLELNLDAEGRIQWVASTPPLVRDISIKTGLRARIQIEKIKNKYIGKPNVPYTQQTLLAELLDYFSYIGYPNAEVQWSERYSKKSVSYDIVILPGRPCTISKIDTPLKLPYEIELKLLKGDVCDLEHIRDELENYEKRLTDDGYQNSSIEIINTDFTEDHSSLHLTIGGTLGNRVNYEFIDESRFFIANALDEETTTYLRKNYSNPFLVKEQVYEYFKTRGYEFVTIRGPLKQVEEDGSITYFYYINPGDNYQISDLIMEGGYQIPPQEIKDAVLTSSVIELFSSDESKSFEQIKSKVIDFYHSRGYWDAEIIKANIEYFKKTKLANIHITLDEGKKRTLLKLNVEGNTKLSTDDITLLLETKVGDAIKQDNLKNFEFKIREKYFDIGYLETQAAVSIESDPDNETLLTSIHVRVEEGEPSYIGTISIKGLVDTEAYVVEREFLFKQGDVYNQDFINQTRTALLNLGIFSSVAIERSEIKKEAQRHEIDLIIKIREGDAGRVKFGPGYNLIRGLNYGSEISYYNLWGTGRRITLRGSFSQEKQQRSISQASERGAKTLLGRKLGASYTEPYLLNLPVSGNLSVLHQAIADDIWKISNSLELSFTHVFNKSYFQGSITPFYRFQLLRDEGTAEQKDSLVTTGFSRIGSVGVRYRLDKRDNLSFPTRGFLFNTELSWARYQLFSQYRYFKWHVSNSVYFGIIKDLVFAVNLGLTSYQQVRRKDSSAENVDVLPANQRLLAGGPNDVRGFDQQLGPYVLIKNPTGYGQEPALGGSQLLLIKSELRKQIIPDLFSMSLFWDMGNSFFSKDELSSFNTKFSSTNTAQSTRSVEENFDYNFEKAFTHPKLLITNNYHAVGFSLGLLTPLGAINASFGWPVKQPVSDTCRLENICNSRSKDKPHWIQKVKVDFNIGAEF